jgi:uncharacterized protein (DUF433 family)
MIADPWSPGYRFACMAEVSTGYRYITRKQDVRGGEAIIEGTRIGVHDVIGLLQNGETVDSILVTCFPALTKAQVYECLAYYEDHRDEINLLVAEQMTDPNA